ncbi:hypothetical protein [Celeribacter sp.]|uniref:portal protein n=1 Tax=Celeribacter sp. TaxID=1890673 RepID=UPI003A916842
MFELDQVSGRIYHNGRGKRASGDAYFAANFSKPDPAEQRENELDSYQAQALHRLLLGYYMRELEAQRENRAMMDRDEGAYDHVQYYEEEIATLVERGQVPIVYNLIQPAVNWILGTQRRSPTDYKILAKDASGEGAAERKSQLMKNVDDANNAAHEVSRAFEGAVKAGVGWLECGYANPEDAPTAVYTRHENWRAMLWDSASYRDDLQDARYIFRSKWLDADTTIALWPNRQHLLERAAMNSGTGAYMGDLDDIGDFAMDAQEISHFEGAMESVLSSYDSPRPRVRVIEAWFKKMVKKAPIMRGGQFNGQLFDDWSIGHHKDLIDGRASLVERPREIIFVALFTETGLLGVQQSPYRHNQYPFTPIWGYRNARTKLPYGIIRGMWDINRDFNKRAAKSLHHLSTTRVMVESGSVEDIEVLRDEAARPDAVIEYNQGRTPPVIDTAFDVAQAHIALMDRDAALLQQSSGVTNENMGRDTNAISGKAIIAKQDQGQLATSLFFDNLAFARSVHGVKQLVTIEQFYTGKERMRFEDKDGRPFYGDINDGDPKNAIAEFAADFILAENDWRASVRQAQAAELTTFLTQLAGTAPQLALAILDLVVEQMDLPKRGEIVRRIRQITGQSDPDEDPNNPTPETMQRQQMQEQQAAMQARAAMAEILSKEARAAKDIASAQNTAAKSTETGVNIIQQAIEAAIQVAGAQNVALAADQIITNSKSIVQPEPQNQQPVPQAQPAPVQ